jgi:hypothetical protein
VRDLLLRAKHLFVAAMVRLGCGEVLKRVQNLCALGRPTKAGNYPRRIIGLASLRMRALCLTTRWRRLVRYSEPLPRRASKLGCHTIRARCH